MATSDERREVAEKLRNIESVYGKQRYPFPEIDFVLALADITGTSLDSTFRDLASRLADLIDPTCRCSECHEPLEPHDKFCHECGCMVVNDDEW